MAKDRDARNVCVTCESTVQPRRLGICPRCYERYRKGLRALPRDQRATYRRPLEQRGYLMPSRQGRRLDMETNVYEAVANAVHEGQAEYTPPPPETP